MQGSAKTTPPATKACARIRLRVTFMLDPLTMSRRLAVLSNHRAMADSRLHTKPSLLTQSTSGRVSAAKNGFFSQATFGGAKLRNYRDGGEAILEAFRNLS